MDNGLPVPKQGSIIYEDDKLYACLANHPITEGHTVVVWKDRVEDLHLLKREEYEYLMDKIDDIRDALLETLDIEKVYLVYMDETRQVHWHLIPRYDEKGFNMLAHSPSELKDLSLAEKIQANLQHPQ